MPTGCDIAVVHYIAAGALAHLAVLEKEATIGGGIVGVFAIEEWKRSAGVIHIPDNGVLIDLRSTAVRRDLVIADIAEVVVSIDTCAAGYLHNFSVYAIDQRNAKRAANAEFSQASRLAAVAIEVTQVLTNRRGEIAEFEVPLPGYRCRGDSLRNSLWRRSAESDHLSIGQLAITNLDAFNVDSRVVIVAVAVGKEQDRMLPGAAGSVERVGGANPILSLHAA